ncbi:hypothetical protein CHELA1G11_20746 [Hyphomicrobiales bacterium]|nr:hypothetical protein CHELA1G11_20746 [Hyphomicrobiales bacterium]CAH1691730.1 hypothetical protein CHELA1G2_21061 [Hyphomicrobiales bacterium]
MSETRLSIILLKKRTPSFSANTKLPETGAADIATIFREIRRNTFTDSQHPELSGYYCVTGPFLLVSPPLAPGGASWRGLWSCAKR